MKNEQGWVIVDGVHCCYCQLADYACPKHGDALPLIRNEDRRREQMYAEILERKGELIVPEEIKEYYAVVRWSTEDVHNHRENMGWVKWTDEEAERWLASMEGNIQDRMTERGWDVIDTLMEE